MYRIVSIAFIAGMIALAGLVNAEDSSEPSDIKRLQGRAFEYMAQEYRGYDALRPLLVVSPDPAPLSLMLKSREYFVVGVPLFAVGVFVSALMAPTVTNPEAYSLAPPVFVLPISIGIAASGATLCILSKVRWNRAIAEFNKSQQSR